ncbi:MAG: glycosyltransferase family 4 protein, partial [Chloroflexota bacterium]|nr:glycosyltransferase family 4 protein [Chloroflexota bacterium]
MRVLMISDFYPPIIGGMELHVRNLSAALARRGHDVALVTLSHPGCPEFESSGGVRVYRVRGAAQAVGSLFADPQRTFAPPFPDPKLALSLRHVVEREQPDVVHAHNWMVHSLLPVKSKGIPLVLTLHDYGLVCAKKSMVREDGRCTQPGIRDCAVCSIGHYGPTKGLLTWLGLRLTDSRLRGCVDMFLPVSESVAVLSGLYSHAASFEVVPNFLPDDFECIDPQADAYTASLPTEDYLLYVGALSPHKGIDHLLAAYERLTDPPPLVLIGAGTPGALPALPKG